MLIDAESLAVSPAKHPSSLSLQCFLLAHLFDCVFVACLLRQISSSEVPIGDDPMEWLRIGLATSGDMGDANEENTLQWAQIRRGVEDCKGYLALASTAGTNATFTGSSKSDEAISPEVALGVLKLITNWRSVIDASSSSVFKATPFVSILEHWPGIIEIGATMATTHITGPLVHSPYSWMKVLAFRDLLLEYSGG